MKRDTFTHAFLPMAEWLKKDAAARDTKPKTPRPPTFQPVDAADVPCALLRVHVVCSVVGMSKATVYRLIADGKFPRPVHITPRCVRWRAADIAAWSVSHKQRATDAAITRGAA